MKISCWRGEEAELKAILSTMMEEWRWPATLVTSCQATHWLCSIELSWVLAPQRPTVLSLPS